MTPEQIELKNKIDAMEKELALLRQQSLDLYYAELIAKPLAERLRYSAVARCPCGAGLAYDPAFVDANGVFRGPLSGHWDCSAILLGTQDKKVKHTAQLPFTFYNVKEEGQPSARGITTRPA